MTADTDFEDRLERRGQIRWRYGRLKHNSHFCVVGFRQESFRVRLKHDQASREFKRSLRSAARLDIAVEIRSRERDDQRTIGVPFVKLNNRSAALSGVKRDQNVGRLLVISLGDIDFVPHRTKHVYPSLGGNSIALPRTRRRRSDDENSRHLKT